MHRKENIRLLIILVALSAITVTLMTTGKSLRRISFQPDMFSVADTSLIDQVKISSGHFTNVLKKENGLWLVNGKYRLDEGLRRTLLPVLKEIRIRRPVPESRRGETMELLGKNGIKVEIFSDNRLIQSYMTGGIKNEGITWFMKSGEKQPFVVHLPGYESYIAGLFEITENDWRDRIVLESNWRTLSQATMAYDNKDGDDFSILFTGNSFDLPGIKEVDTAQVMNYLDMMTYILADKYLNRGELPVYDSLAASPPYATLQVEKMGKNQPETIVFYPLLDQDRYILGKVNGDQLALFEYNRIKGLFATKKEFLKEGS